MARGADRIARGVEIWREERPDLDTSGTEVVWRVLRLGALFWDAIDTVVAEVGLKPRSYSVLAVLRTHGRPDYRLPAKVLLQATYLTTGGLTSLLNRMEEQGLIERHPDPNDRRSIIVALTTHGREVIDRAVEEVSRLERTLAEELPESDRAEFADLVGRYLERIDRLSIAFR